MFEIVPSMKKDVLFFTPVFKIEKNSPRISKSKYLRTNVFHIFKIFINFCCIVGLIPFRVTVTNGLLVFKQSKLRMIICSALHAICFLYQLLNFRIYSTVFGSPIKKDPSKLYMSAMLIFSTLMFLAFSILCIRPKSSNSLHSVLVVLFDFKNDDKNDTRKMQFGTICFFIMSVMSAAIFWNDSIGLVRFIRNSGSLIDFVNISYSKIYYTLFLTVEDPPHSEMTNLKICVAIMYVFLNAYYFIIINIAQSVGFLTCFTIYKISRDFRQSVIQRTEMDLKQITQCYREVKSLANVLNRVFGTLLIVCIMTSIPYFGTHFLDIIDSTDWITKFHIIYYCVLSFTFLILAAEGHRNIQAMSEYLFENQEKLYETSRDSDVSLLITEISTTQVGLKGHGYFTITYGFMGNILSLVLTHIIIMLQFQSSSESTANKVN